MRLSLRPRWRHAVLFGLWLSVGCASHDPISDHPNPSGTTTTGQQPTPNNPAPTPNNPAPTSNNPEPTPSNPGPAPVDVSEQLNSEQQAEFANLVAKVDEAHTLDGAALLDKHELAFGELSYEPANAEFMDRIQASALALNDVELAKLAENGFVISTRHGFGTFVRGYAEVYSEHLPVYVSADAILEALHSSYDELLLATERTALIPKVTSLLEHAHVSLASHAGDAAAKDLDLYLSVARSLLTGAAMGPVAGADATAIDAIVSQANAAEGLAELNLFGVDRSEDMSQFTPRGHYTDDEQLERYFRAMMWLGRIDFRLVETLSDGSVVLRRPQVNAALLLRELLSESDLAAWQQVDSALRVFIGKSDYMVMPEVDKLLEDLGGYEAALAASDEAVHAAIVDGGYGIQSIASHIMVNDGTTKTLPLNRSFALFGQRYILDSHVFSQVVYDRTADARMMPSPLDAAYAALGNDAALPLLGSELSTYNVDYPGNLEAVRVLADAHGEDFWGASLYNLWLGALRELSPKPEEVADPGAAGLPEVVGTEPWSRRVLNTQLGSWAELRHDTLLYAKQSYSGVPSCEYPDAYVDPYPEFYQRLVTYADLGLTLANDLGADLGSAEASVVGYFENLKSSMTQLGEMAQNQREGVAFSEAQLAFINNAVRIEQQSAGCTTVEVPDGWLAGLYLTRDKSIEFDPTIADVHTQPADAAGNIVGNVLHVATGYPRLMVTTVDTCQGPRAYVGVSFAYHEQVTSDFKRLTDEEWYEQVAGATDVEWVKPILAVTPEAPPMD